MGDRGQAVPLTPFQATLVRLLSQNRTEDSYLAGGAALHLQPNSTRYSNDLDYFHDSEERVASAFAADRALLESEGYDLELVLNQPGYLRAIASKDGSSTKIEWAHDSAWRFLPAIRSEEAGYQLHPVDLATNKLLALAGRDEPRDFIDTLTVVETTLGLGALCWAAAGKDPGFTPPAILDLLRRRGRVRPEDLDRLHLTERPDLSDLKRRWRQALEEAAAFIASRPPEETGCLYWSSTEQRFVDRELERADVVPHFGRPGGVLPRVLQEEP